MDQNNCQHCKKLFDSIERIPKILQCGCIICAHCISAEINFDDKFFCKAHKEVFKGKVTDIKDFVTTESFQKQLNSFKLEVKLDLKLKDCQQRFNVLQMKYNMCQKVILKVQKCFYSIIKQVCRQVAKDICEMLQGEIKQGVQIIENLRGQIESLKKTLSCSSESIQQHEERINMLNQVQAKYEITKQKIQEYKQVEFQEYNESELALDLSESCFQAIQYVQDKANNQILEEQGLSMLIAQFLFEKEKYEFQILASENVQSFVKRFSSQVVSVAKLRENPLNKSSICQDKDVIKQFIQNSGQSLIKKLNEVVELSKSSEEIEQAAANAITILKNMNHVFSQRNFEGIRIRGADLSDVIFQDCNFKNANLQEVNLRNAKLVNCNFNKANLTNVQLETSDQASILSGHTYGINSVVISPDSNYIISASGDNTIKIWDFQTGNLLRTLTGHSH